MPSGCKRAEDEQPCWHCENFAGGCSWSRDFTPVEGWDAAKVEKKYDKHTDRVLVSYKIRSCPEFVFDE